MADMPYKVSVTKQYRERFKKAVRGPRHHSNLQPPPVGKVQVNGDAIN